MSQIVPCSVDCVIGYSCVASRYDGNGSADRRVVPRPACDETAVFPLTNCGRLHTPLGRSLLLCEKAYESSEHLARGAEGTKPGNPQTQRKVERSQAALEVVIEGQLTRMKIIIKIQMLSRVRAQAAETGGVNQNIHVTRSSVIVVPDRPHAITRVVLGGHGNVVARMR